MTTISTWTVKPTEYMVSEFHYGANLLGDSHGTFGGDISDLMKDVIEHLEITHIRFPSGKIDSFFATGMVVRTESGVFLTDEVQKFLDDARSLGLSVTMGVPVDPPIDYQGKGVPQDDSSFRTDLSDFVKLIAENYPDVVTQYELGNEYWDAEARQKHGTDLEGHYGEMAARSAIAIQAGLEGNNLDINVFLQSSQYFPWTAYTDTVKNHQILEHAEKKANAQIRLAFEDTASSFGFEVSDLIDGIYRNKYWDEISWREDVPVYNDKGFRNREDFMPFSISESFEIETDNWDTWAGKDLIMRIGEWNIKGDHGWELDSKGYPHPIKLESLNGKYGFLDLAEHGARMILEQFDNIIKYGVDQANIWPLVHNTVNALLHSSDEAIATENVAGLDIASNSTRLAMFDLLRQTVDDHLRLDVVWTAQFDSDRDDASDKGWRFEGFPQDIEVTAYISMEDSMPITEVIIFLSSADSEPIIMDEVRINDEEFLNNPSFGFDPSPFILEDFILVASRAISIDVNHTEPLSLTERSHAHHDDAVISDRSQEIGPDGMLHDFILNPHEVVQLTYWAIDKNYAGTNGDDNIRLFGTEVFFALDGCDKISVNKKFSADSEIHAGFGNDTVRAGNGSDLLDGSKGHDILVGGRGRDSLFGGKGCDILRAGHGSDLAVGDQKSDLLFGGKGNDTLLGGNGADVCNGQRGRDLLLGGNGEDYLIGGLGQDTLIGGKGDDSLVGGRGRDVFVFESKYGDDTILDFDADVDIIDLNGLKLTLDWEVLVNDHITVIEEDVHISVGLGTIVIQDLDPSSLTADNFVL